MGNVFPPPNSKMVKISILNFLRNFKIFQNVENGQNLQKFFSILPFLGSANQVRWQKFPVFQSIGYVSALVAN